MNTEAEVQPAGVSMQDRLRGGRIVKHEARPIRIALPRCMAVWADDLGVEHETPMVARYHALDYREIRAINRQSESIRDRDERELTIAVDTLIAACDAIEADVAGETVETGARVGCSLLEYIDPATATQGLSDRQAVFLLFADEELALVAHSNDYATAAGLADLAVSRELAGESVAAGSSS